MGAASLDIVSFISKCFFFCFLHLFMCMSVCAHVCYSVLVEVTRQHAGVGFGLRNGIQVVRLGSKCLYCLLNYLAGSVRF